MFPLYISKANKDSINISNNETKPITVIDIFKHKLNIKVGLLLNIQVYIHNYGSLLKKDKDSNITLSPECHKKIFKAFGLNYNHYKKHVVYQHLKDDYTWILLAGGENPTVKQNLEDLKNDDEILVVDGVQQSFQYEDLVDKRLHEKTFLIEELAFNQGHNIYRITEVD